MFIRRKSPTKSMPAYRFSNVRFLVATALCFGSLGCFFVRTPKAVLGIDNPEAQTTYFDSTIEPILRENCWSCHSDLEQEGELRLDRLASMLKGGTSAEPAIVPSRPADSYLIQVVTGSIAGKQMPPDEPLTTEQINHLRNWIAGGAATPERYGPTEEAIPLDHWAFQPLSTQHRQSSVDSFVNEKLVEKGINPNGKADPLALLRRLSLVLHGVPPTVNQVVQFSGNVQPESWLETVESYLANPRFGESFATVWLDLVRFGETDGFETNRERPNAWHYRDWVIQSFNSDLPYDQFLKQQLAGDTLGQPIGTGFLVAGPHDIVKGQDEKLGLMQRQNELDDIIGVTGTAFMGLTIGCARCHNHKFDPVSQRDYYAMQAIFAGVRHGESRLPMTDEDRYRLNEIAEQITSITSQVASIQGNSRRKRPAVSSIANVEEFLPQQVRWIRMTIHSTNGGQPCIDEFEVFSGGENIALASSGTRVKSSGDFEHPLHQLSHINDGAFGNSKSWISSHESGGWVEFELPDIRVIERIEWARDRLGEYKDRVPTSYIIEVASERGQWRLLSSSEDRAADPNANPFNIDLDSLSPQEAQNVVDLREQYNKLLTEKERILSRSKVWAGEFSQPGNTFRLYRGEPEYPREQVNPGVPKALGPLELESDLPESQRRLALANWITSPDNPLTARVIVNRIWQFHFGVGLVDTPSDFGKNGTLPTHPELLDWLAVELIKSGWSLKHIHRLILLSETWQRDSRPQPEGLSQDSLSRFLWRFPPRRLSAESLRDSVLQVAGTLNSSEMGGPGFSVFEVELENVRHYHPRNEFGPDQWRRAIYMTRVRQEKDDVFGAFDCPDFSMSVPARNVSVTPIQALNLLNGKFMIQQSELFALRISNDSDQVDERVTSAWNCCFQRQPTPTELSEACEFVDRHGWKNLCRALLNSNEFAYFP